jgi:16S rRNA methyltransferase GidB
MTEAEQAATLRDGARRLGLDLAPETGARLLEYLGELQHWNAAYNLTAVRDRAQMVTRHLLDSLAVLPHLGKRRGWWTSAAGRAAGIPLAMVAPQRSFALVESNGKKARFLRHVQRRFDLANVEVLEQRSEACRPASAYDVVLARALAPLPELLLLTAHLAGANGRWLAMKGKLAPSELDGLPAGFAILDVIALDVPGLDETRHLICVGRA